MYLLIAELLQNSLVCNQILNIVYSCFDSETGNLACENLELIFEPILLADDVASKEDFRIDFDCVDNVLQILENFFVVLNEIFTLFLPELLLVDGLDVFGVDC